MRPRGESISTRNSRYVGHAFKHSPQCTHLSRSACCGLSNEFTSDAAIQPAAIEKAFGIEHLLDLLHHRKVAARLRPKLYGLANTLWREFNHTARRQIRHVRIISPTHARSRPGESRHFGAFHHLPNVRQRARNPHHYAFFMRQQKPRRKLTNLLP